jgi:hypothetical protein
MGWAVELDLCEVPRLQRHLFEFRCVSPRGIIRPGEGPKSRAIEQGV